MQLPPPWLDQVAAAAVELLTWFCLRLGLGRARAMLSAVVELPVLGPLSTPQMVAMAQKVETRH
jgi:hypothetical protein